MFMILNILLLTISTALFAYLVYALLRPEKF
jgi:K+-transporting ATPase KdpF subunit